MTRTRPPAWFWIVVAVLILWGFMGVFAFYTSLSEIARASMSTYDRRLYESQPGWYSPVYGISIWAGLAGSVLLALKRRLAWWFYLVSLIGVVVMFGWIFATTDLIAAKGIVTATGFPIVIALVCLFQLWIAKHAAQRGWIG
jgi:hypothetical protein